jgi:NAD(P)-dependent dehydrogenase (short-subunit alcohol dehydrogenase family)
VTGDERVGVWDPSDGALEVRADRLAQEGPMVGAVGVGQGHGTASFLEHGDLSGNTPVGGSVLATMLLKANLLSERTIALGGDVRPAVRGELTRLGARLLTLDGAVEAPVHALVYDAAASFGPGGPDALRAAVDDGWSAIHALATTAFIPSGTGAAIVLLAPRAQDGAYATAVRAALENTARTLSIEWARFAITTTAIAPGAGTTDEEIATLVAFLVSPAGGYFSGCRFELGGVGAEHPIRA